MKVYLDYSGNGIWALATAIDMPFPRINVCASPNRLVQIARELELDVELSDSAKLVCDNDLQLLSWQEQSKKMRLSNHPECRG